MTDEKQRNATPRAACACEEVERTLAAPEGNLSTAHDLERLGATLAGLEQFDRVPEWAALYIMTRDGTDLTADDMRAALEWASGNGVTDVFSIVEESRVEFDRSPAFGLPTSTVSIIAHTNPQETP